jgi:group I intron endonuclease
MNESINIWEEKNSIDHNLNLLPRGENDNSNTIIETRKKLIEKQWSDTGKISGIYVIVNKINHKYYVGSSNNIINDRWYNHLMTLNGNRHSNHHLQRSWNKYGKDNFEFYVVEYANINDLLVVEQKYLDYAKLQRERVYNQSFISGRIEMTDEIRKKISMSQKGKKCISNYDRWVIKFGKEVADEKHKQCNDKHKIIMLNNNHFKGKNHSIESLKKISDASLKNCKNYNKTIYHFQNIETLEEFTGYKKDFVRKYSLNPSSINYVITGKRYHHKNWALYGKNKPKYALISDVKYKWYNPELNLYRECSQYDLRNEFNLLSGSVNNVIKKRRKSCRGWVLVA